MKKEYWEYLKENDPIHYLEMKGDPVTGLPTNSYSTISLLLFFLGLIGLGIVIGKLM